MALMLALFASCRDVRGVKPSTTFEESDQEAPVRQVLQEVAASLRHKEDPLPTLDLGPKLEKLRVSEKAFIRSAIGSFAKPQQKLPRNRETMIFFDWDDTLICTHHLAQRTSISRSLGIQLFLLAKRVEKLLLLSIQLGKVFIVTNAEHGWVEASATVWMPQLLPLLKSGKIEIISARTKFEEEHPHNAYIWKTKTFLAARQDHQKNPETFTNIIAVGDSPYEIAAAKALGRACSQSVVKTVKFVHHPSPKTLNDQLEYLLQEMKWIERCGHAIDLAL
mmetsp:Transcript_88697/g.185411  ORF Transcript_88697/g.185411 Transcript_88697/m.185411 type:complete len:278 (-) Transcript_88697:25-858(-)